MATTTTCDKCGKALKNYEQNKLAFYTADPFDNIDVPKEEYDFCDDCIAEVYELLDAFIEPKED